MKDAAQSTPDAVVRDILHGLSEGRYVPGQRLSEPDLMAIYAVGRSTVREALSRLAAGGVVVQTPHRGAMIRHLTRAQAADVLQVTAVLLGLAARQAAQAVAAGACVRGLQQAALDYAQTGTPRDRARYYRALMVLAGNAELERILPALQVHLIRAQMRALRHDPPKGRAEMVAAIAAGAAEAAETAARTYVLASLATFDLAENEPHKP